MIEPHGRAHDSLTVDQNMGERIEARWCGRMVERDGVEWWIDGREGWGRG